MIILGLDPGLAQTGFGVLRKEGDKLQSIAFGVITTPKTQVHPQRLQAQKKQLLKLLKKHRPEVIALEKIFFAKNKKTALLIAQVRGVFLATIAEKNLVVKEFAPNQIKAALCGFGHASKNQIQKMVQNILGLKEKPTPDDATDALAVAICCSFLIK